MFRFAGRLYFRPILKGTYNTHVWRESSRHWGVKIHNTSNAAWYDKNRIQAIQNTLEWVKLEVKVNKTKLYHIWLWLRPAALTINLAPATLRVFITSNLGSL